MMVEGFHSSPVFLSFRHLPILRASVISLRRVSVFLEFLMHLREVNDYLPLFLDSLSLFKILRVLTP